MKTPFRELNLLKGVFFMQLAAKGYLCLLPTRAK